MAKENNRGSITNAQKAGWTTKSHTKPDPQSRRKSGPKPGTKRKQTEVIAIGDAGTGNGNASEPVPVLKSRAKRKRIETEDGVEDSSPRRLRKRV
jgi:hypothetical protein